MGKPIKSLQGFLNDMNGAGMGNLGSKVRAIIVATLTLPSSESAIAGKALLPIVKPLFSAFVEHSLDIQNNLGLSVLDGDDEPIPFGDLQPDVQLENWTGIHR